MTCLATPDAHCCWVNGKVCPYFDPVRVLDSAGCKLRSELGSWAAVHEDSRYLRDVKNRVPSFTGTNADCGNYPQGKTCATCGAE